MAQIKIDNLSVTGSDLFSDSESYLDELSNDSEMSSIKGGFLCLLIAKTIICAIMD